MNKFFFIVLITFFLSTFLVKAQKKGLLVGVKVTPEYTFWNSSNKFFDFQEPRFALGGGIQVIKNLNNHFGFETGLSFINRGWKMKADIRDEQGRSLGVVTFKSNYNYLGIPLLVRVNFKTLYVSAGPSIDFFLFYYQKPDSHGMAWGDANKVNMSLPVSLGYQKSLTDRVTFYIEARYNPLLNDVYSSGPDKQRNQNLGLGLGASYFLK